MPKRRVILLKPLQESVHSLPDCHFQPIRIARTDSTTTDTSSVLSFSPTSVLPQQHEHGSGSLFKALRKDHRPASDGFDEAGKAHAETEPSLAKPCGSWVSRQVVRDLSEHHSSLSPLPGASSPATAAPIIIRPQVTPRQPKVLPANKPSTLDAAWRWKFRRQWGKEQLRSHLPDIYHDHDDEACNDPWHDALHMIQAANTTPEAGVPISDHDCYAEASPSPLLDDDDLDGLLEMDSSPNDVREMVRTCSSQALAQAAAKACELRQFQVHNRLWVCAWHAPVLQVIC